MTEFRFGFNVFGIRSRQDFVEQCRTAEALGYDTALVPDHLGGPAPFPTLIAAAEATERLRVGTMVLNVGFWNPHLLAREVATADLLTGGRLELGLGSGHMKWEFDAAGIGWEPLADRTERLARTVEELGRLLRGPDYEERAQLRSAFDLPDLTPVQRRGFGGSGPPLLIGGTGDAVLRLAAEHADIVGHAGAIQLKGRPPGTFRLATAAEMDERVAFVREHAGERAGDLESNVLVQMVVVTRDRRAVAEKLVSEQPTFTVDEALESPLLLIGTVEQIAERLLENRERYGFSYITVHEPYMTELAPVIERLRAG
ncbi:LLM class F420-dependent oxidoreductase [Actinomadura sp. HBU206391]|uniref:LLM class F420-dependent oxidoreductase n=1 Tax=Actinomadura sp. HBU206391 TaxID=2731692 RepID=UPI001650077A|nr:LLM class F420-dependent oxidoreductase [Actinomadura sp. HBU206391]MBC6459696.1 LLM class F420-dependent oxidoreductase [Actinomadura sp. HBU206391]